MMTVLNDPRALLTRAVDQIAAVIDGISPDQAGLPTPCRSWDVATLLGHLLEDVRYFSARASGERTDPPGAAAVAPDADWAADFRKASDGLLALWRDAGDLTATFELPGIGEVPARFPVDQQIAEFAVHAWDLATATGQDVELDPEIAQTALDWGRTALRPQFRGSEDEGRAFGPQVDAAEDAPVYERLAAFFGRPSLGRPGLGRNS
jgi:uncharacterized protein (TIGR03086 family)